jgi:hypothetical protein
VSKNARLFLPRQTVLVYVGGIVLERKGYLILQVDIASFKFGAI